MTNDADTLATALYATAGDMLKEHPGLAPWRPPAGITPRLSDAELVTLATMQPIKSSSADLRAPPQPSRCHQRRAGAIPLLRGGLRHWGFGVR